MDRYESRVLKKVMKDKGLNISDLVLELSHYTPKVSRALVTGWLNGSCPSAVNMYVLSKILDVELDDLFVRASKSEKEDYLRKRLAKRTKREATQIDIKRGVMLSINKLIKKIDAMSDEVARLKKTKKKRKLKR